MNSVDDGAREFINDTRQHNDLQKYIWSINIDELITAINNTANETMGKRKNGEQNDIKMQFKVMAIHIGHDDNVYVEIHYLYKLYFNIIDVRYYTDVNECFQKENVISCYKLSIDSDNKINMIESKLMGKSYDIDSKHSVYR